MTNLLTPALGYILIVVSITLLFLEIIQPKSVQIKIVMGVLLVLSGGVCVYFNANPFSFLSVALSPLIFYMGVRRTRPNNILVVISIFILAIAPIYLFLDQDGLPLVSNRWAWVSVVSAIILWLSTERLRNVEGRQLGSDPDSVVGLLGETLTDIEPFSAGSVMVGGEVWQARSKTPIPAGSAVRVLRQDGFWLTVKQVERLTPDKSS